MKEAELKSMTKADLQTLYTEKLEETPGDKITKDELIKSILDAGFDDSEEKEAKIKPAPAAQIAPKLEGIGSVTLHRKSNEHGSGEDEHIKLPIAVYNALPAHKHGWKVAKPSELK